MGIKIILTGSDLGELADIFQGLQRGLWVVSLLFLFLSILLFVKFNLKNYFRVILKHNQKKVSEKYRPQNMASHTQKIRKTSNMKQKGMTTEQLSSEMTELLEPDQATEVLSEEQLVFTMGTSVELYTEVLDES